VRGAQVEAVPADTSQNQSPVWRELEDSRGKRTPVQGRVLNACAGGYAVGVAGIVALLPYGRFTMETVRRVGTLQPFVVESVNEQRRLLVVADVKKGANRSLRA
jgi:ribosomal protein S1